MTTKQVFRDTGIECVGRDVYVVSQQTKCFLRDDKMQETGHAANTAVAFRRRNVGSRVDLESNVAAMASPLVCYHCVILLSFCQMSSKLFAGIAYVLI